MIAIDPLKHGVEHRSGPFDELINYLYNISGNLKRVRRIMGFKVPRPNSNRARIHYLFICYQYENRSPCNGFLISLTFIVIFTRFTTI